MKKLDIELEELFENTVDYIDNTLLANRGEEFEVIYDKINSLKIQIQDLINLRQISDFELKSYYSAEIDTLQEQKSELYFEGNPWSIELQEIIDEIAEEKELLSQIRLLQKLIRKELTSRKNIQNSYEFLDHFLGLPYVDSDNSLLITNDGRVWPLVLQIDLKVCRNSMKDQYMVPDSGLLQFYFDSIAFLDSDENEYCKLCYIPDFSIE